MSTINIQKSKLAALVGAGWDAEKIAKHFGITIAEVRKAKNAFGIGVRAKEAGYHINLIDDMSNIESSPLAESVSTDNGNSSDSAESNL
jgi:hypothetical protein